MRTNIWAILMAMLSAGICSFAQKFEVGVVAGTNLTYDFRSLSLPLEQGNTFLSQSQSRTFIAGPMVEFGISGNLAVEINALHRSLQYVDYTVRPDGSRVTRKSASVGTW